LLKALQAAEIKISLAPEENIKAGLTGAIAGIAETGSLLISSGQGQPLTASLLPETHIAVIHADDIYETLPEVLNLEPIREASSSVLISGPSRTADIEMTLTIGVHGPRELHVLCID
jgi:L-lactate dehydrogenase complex protein LldG